MVTSQVEQLRHDRKAWEDAVTQILGHIPDQATGDDAERLASALRSVSSLLQRLSPQDRADQKAA